MAEINTSSVDNFDKILPMLHYHNDDIFYSVQILRRKKDNKNATIRLGKNNNSRTIKSYYVYSNEMLLDLKAEMIALCNIFNARISINLNAKSFSKAAYENNSLIAEYLKSHNYKFIKNSYDKAVARANINSNRYWIVDVDKEDLQEVNTITEYINILYNDAKLHNSDLKNKIISIIPTKTGLHIIANPFNKKKFYLKFPNIEIKDNNPTNLYIP